MGLGAVGARLCYNPLAGKTTSSPIAGRRVQLDRGVLTVMLWNFPCWQVSALVQTPDGEQRRIAQRASNVPGCTLAIENIFRAAGLPENIFRRSMICNRKVEAQWNIHLCTR
jgi:hypothetical protein